MSAAEYIASEGELERDLIVAIFDAEEPPYFQTGSMGSRRFYEDQLDGRPIHAAIIMDLVGHDVSVHSPHLVQLLRQVSKLKRENFLSARVIPSCA